MIIGVIVDVILVVAAEHINIFAVSLIFLFVVVLDEQAYGAAFFFFLVVQLGKRNVSVGKNMLGGN